MNEDLLSSSDKYLKKSNRTLLLVGIFAFLAFFVGLIILLSGGEQQKEDAKVTVDGASDAFTDISGGGADNFAAFGDFRRRGDYHYAVFRTRQHYGNRV